MSFQQVLPVVSNAFFFLPAFKAVAMGRWTRAIIFFLIPFTSGSFHLCDEMNLCLCNFVYLKNLDYLFALWQLPLTDLYFVHWGKTWAFLERFLIVLYGMGLWLGIALGNGDMMAQMLVAGTSIFIPILYWIAYFCNRVLENPKRKFFVNCCTAEYEDTAKHEGRYFPKYEWGYMLCGVSLTGLGVLLFALQPLVNPSDGWLIHAFWHMCAALGQYYILGIKAPVSRAAFRVLDSELKHIDKDALLQYLIDNREFLIQNIDKPIKISLIRR
jgi:hypothetical protein